MTFIFHFQSTALINGSISIRLGIFPNCWRSKLYLSIQFSVVLQLFKRLIARQSSTRPRKFNNFMKCRAYPVMYLLENNLYYIFNNLFHWVRLFLLRKCDNSLTHADSNSGDQSQPVIVSVSVSVTFTAGGIFIFYLMKKKWQSRMQAGERTSHQREQTPSIIACEMTSNPTYAGVHVIASTRNPAYCLVAKSQLNSIPSVSDEAEACECTV